MEYKTTVEQRTYQQNYYRKIVQRDGGWRKHKLKQRYGITEEDYQRMYKAQNGLCRICGNPPYSGKPLHIDHSHTTNQVRGLLCFKCNNMLGLSGDDPEVLEQAAIYLRSFNT